MERVSAVDTNTAANIRTGMAKSAAKKRAAKNEKEKGDVANGDKRRIPSIY